MNLFLTSNIGGYYKKGDKKYSTKYSEDNMFLINLRNSIKDNKKFILIASDPNDFDKNDLYLNLDIESLKLSGLEFEENIVLDYRNSNNISDILNNASLIILSGGDTFIQNNFFNEINLKNYIKDIDSCIIGISAGTINCAKDVFNSPEDEEDLNKPSTLNGLGLTNINIEPHFDLNNDNKIQMNSIINESYNIIIYGIPDGSYIFNNTIYGKCYKIYNGEFKLLCDLNETYQI